MKIACRWLMPKDLPREGAARRGLTVGSRASRGGAAARRGEAALFAARQGAKKQRSGRRGGARRSTAAQHSAAQQHSTAKRHRWAQPMPPAHLPYPCLLGIGHSACPAAPLWHERLRCPTYHHLPVAPFLRPVRHLAGGHDITMISPRRGTAPFRSFALISVPGRPSPDVRYRFA